MIATADRAAAAHIRELLALLPAAWTAEVRRVHTYGATLPDLIEYDYVTTLAQAGKDALAELAEELRYLARLADMLGTHAARQGYSGADALAAGYHGRHADLDAGAPCVDCGRFHAWTWRLAAAGRPGHAYLGPADPDAARFAAQAEHAARRARELAACPRDTSSWDPADLPGAVCHGCGWWARDHRTPAPVAAVLATEGDAPARLELPAERRRRLADDAAAEVLASPAVTAMLDAADVAGRFTVDGMAACGAPVDGGRCGRAPGHDGHPHIRHDATPAPRDGAR